MAVLKYHTQAIWLDVSVETTYIPKIFSDFFSHVLFFLVCFFSLFLLSKQLVLFFWLAVVVA